MKVLIELQFKREGERERERETDTERERERERKTASKDSIHMKILIELQFNLYPFQYFPFIA